MNILCRSRLLISLVCRSSSLLEQKGVLLRGVSNKARCISAHLTSCQQHWLQTASVRSGFDTKRCYSDSGGSTHSESKDTFEEESHEMDDNNRNNGSFSQSSSETFTLDVLVSLLRQENAVDLCVIKVPDHIKYTEYFVVVSGLSPRHLRAMALYAIKVYKFLKKDGEPNIKIEGKDAEDWMCLDFGHMVVHFMLPETREVYELEKLWTLRAFDEQLKRIPAEVLPEDFILDVELTK
ncbi:mitochondrial assembly of ribosomal large subunit protein 1 [Leuresthes tenuis]|uniref:mitochondrial assembly of ribosomal large subunit protein 1 n=1 Tax=Leuresthes tenuis TaxID=355514 RepID=UPI003B50A911